MSYILVPVDFSPTSENALRYAIELAKTKQLNIKVLHVYPIPISAPDVPAELILAEEIRNDANERIESLAKKFGNSDAVIQTKTVAGSPGSEIAYITEQSQPDLIVMGTHGASQKKNRWLGSNTMHVIDRVTVPVLAVPDNVSFQPWKNICCATDFDYHEIDSIKKLSNWSKLFGAELVLVHVNDGKLDEKNDAPAYRESFIKKARELTGVSSIQYEFVSSNINLVSELREFAVFHKSDVLVMMHRLQKGLTRLWHHSLTKDMIESLPMALLSYPVTQLELANTDKP